MSDWIDAFIKVGTFLSLAIIVSSTIKSFVLKTRKHMVTKSGWIRVEGELKKLREDSDRHEVLIAEGKTQQKFIIETISEIKKQTRETQDFINRLLQNSNFPCPHHPIKSKDEKC